MYLLLPIWMVRHAFPTKLIVALIGFGALGSTGLMNGEVDGFDFFKVWEALCCLLPITGISGNT